MTKRIFHTIFRVAMGVFLISLVLFLTVLYDYFSGIQQEQLRIQADLAAQGVQDEGIKYLEGLTVQDYRITWIGTDGSILYESSSDVGEMENHFQREEVREALAEGYGQSSRYSDTLTERYLYSAKRLPDGTVIRLSAAQYSLPVLAFGMLQPIGIVFLAAIALSALLASRLSKNIVSPLNRLDLDDPLENSGYDELSPLLLRISAQQKEIKRQKSEFKVLTASMAEGLVLLNAEGTVLSINHAAEKLFEVGSACVGQDLLAVTGNQELAGLLRQAKDGVHAEAVMGFGFGKYQVEASPVFVGSTVSGLVLLLLDVTEKVKAEQMRREFTANVSHELKTPLHTISGSAELLAGGLVKPEDTASFSQQIYKESRRMIRLVEDIIKLSHLDEGAGDMKWEEIDLYLLAEETVQLLAAEAGRAEVELALRGEEACVYGNRQLLESILYNLCDNAIKYNRKGGTAVVEVRQEEGCCVLSVADSGIGIPQEHQKRIFERFYRVDKSHSKAIGGTGLGLSIVKHAVMLHKAELSLQSEMGKGTVVRVLFGKKGDALFCRL